MSIISSLLLVLLSLSFDACNARRLCATKNVPMSEFQLSHKNDEKISSFNVQPKENHAVSNKLDERIDGDRVLKSRRVLNDEEDHDQKTTNLKEEQKELKDQRVKSISGEMETESHVYWVVPKKKHSEHQPGFTLDYSPPKTHPPTHN